MQPCYNRAPIAMAIGKELQEVSLMGKLDGKVALVTGSGRNIGRATVLKLAAEGAHVVVNSRTNQAEADAVAQEVRAGGGKAPNRTARTFPHHVIERAADQQEEQQRHRRIEISVRTMRCGFVEAEPECEGD